MTWNNNVLKGRCARGSLRQRSGASYGRLRGRGCIRKEQAVMHASLWRQRQLTVQGQSMGQKRLGEKMPLAMRQSGRRGRQAPAGIPGPVKRRGGEPLR